MKLKRSVAGVAYGSTSHLLDVANFANTAYKDISIDSLKNCFKKANIIPGVGTGDNTDYDDVTIVDIVEMLNKCKLLNGSSETNVKSEIEKYLNDENKDLHMY